ncbi:MAG: glycoside hydrolase family 3 C-terminal domain-containing protein, partial [Kiritimatiellia bacterium]
LWYIYNDGNDQGVPDAEGGGDRVRIGLPGKQLELLKKLHATGKPVVLVLTGGSPIELNWAKENIPAIMMVWYPGEAGGHAFADVLFGDCNPAGRLPLTFIKSLEDIPAFTDYNMKGRTYRFMEKEPLYRFGYGLSYTRFSYGKLDVSREAATGGDEPRITVSAEVVNTGERDGDEVAQLYVKDVEASVPVPRCQLRGFQRVHLKAGESRKVSFTLSGHDLVCFDDDGNPFFEAGAFELHVGGGQPGDPDMPGVSTHIKISAKGEIV